MFCEALECRCLSWLAVPGMRSPVYRAVLRVPANLGCSFLLTSQSTALLAFTGSPPAELR
jgi:hypothetical protein